MIIDDDYIDKLLDRVVDDPNRPMNLAHFKLYKKPKLRISRLPDDKKLVPIVLDIPVNEKLTFRERFDWNLNKDYISPTEFVEKFCHLLGLAEKEQINLRNQILTQIIDFIEKNTFFPRNRGGKEDRLDEKMPSTLEFEKVLEKTSLNFKETFAFSDHKPIIKLTARQKTLEKMKQSNENFTNKPFYSKKLCKFCLHKHLTPVTECKNCKMPFNILEDLNIKDKTIKLSLKYFQICANTITVLTELNLHKELVPDDFQSVFILKNKLSELLKLEEDLLENKEIVEKSLNSLNEIQVDFLKGKYNDESKENDENKNDPTNEKSNMSLIKKEIRKRGRPRKYFHTRKYFIKKTHHA